MLKKTPTIIFFLVLAIVLYVVYQSVRLPDGVKPQSSSSDELIAWLTLGAAIISLVASIIGLIEKIIERRNRRD